MNTFYLFIVIICLFISMIYPLIRLFFYFHRTFIQPSLHLIIVVVVNGFSALF
jgi:hypothetical protein